MCPKLILSLHSSYYELQQKGRQATLVQDVTAFCVMPNCESFAKFLGSNDFPAMNTAVPADLHTIAAACPIQGT